MANLSTSTWGQEQQVQDHASILAWAKRAMALAVPFTLKFGEGPDATAVISFVNPPLHQLILRPPADAANFNHRTHLPIAVVAFGQHWQFSTSLLAVKNRFLKLAIPAKIQIMNQRFAYRFEVQNQNYGATFTNYTALSFDRERMYQQATILDISCTGIALKILPNDMEILHLQDQLIFTYLGGQEVKQKISGEVVHIIEVRPWAQNTYFKVGIRFARPLAMPELSTYINPGLSA